MGGSSFYNSSWETNLDQGDPFDSALTSIVSSPVAPPPPDAAPDNSLIRELLGRLGTICTSAPDPSFVRSGACSADTSCYTTPLSSPPKVGGLSMMERNSWSRQGYQPTHLPLPADSGFVERAARLSCFGGGRMIGSEDCGLSELPLQLVERVEPGRFSRVPSCHNVAGGSRNGNLSENGEMGESPEGSSISEQVPRPSMANSARKRKYVTRGKMKESPATSSMKDAEDSGENEQLSEKKNKKNDVKPPEPPKDYIHVRAGRGQATDSHSLAERVRREKISQRMKVLQDLVPGCNKVTGKAVMLDEIINYVQSLQHQVEFLSMKLTTLNPRVDFDVESFKSKEMTNPHGSSFFAADSASSGFPYGYHHPQAMHLHGAMGSNTETQFPLNALNAAVHTGMGGFCEASSIGVSGLWEDELHNVVQMGIPPSQQPQQRLQGSLTAGQMKTES